MGREHDGNERVTALRGDARARGVFVFNMGIHYTIFLCCFSPELSLVVLELFLFSLVLRVYLSFVWPFDDKRFTISEDVSPRLPTLSSSTAIFVLQRRPPEELGFDPSHNSFVFFTM